MRKILLISLLVLTMGLTYAASNMASDLAPKTPVVLSPNKPAGPPSPFNISWATMAPLNGVGRYWCPGTGVVRETIWFLGGRTADATLPSIDSIVAYVPATNTWINNGLYHLLTTRRAGGGGRIGNKIYVAGGRDASNVTVATCEEFDVDTKVITAKASMPVAHWAVAGGIAVGKLYIVGDELNGTGTYEYDPIGNSWATKTPIPVGRGWSAAAGAGSYLYVFGGAGSSATLSDCWRFDPIGNSWTAMASMSGPREYHSAVALDDSIIYVIGGSSAGGACDNIVYKYRIASNTWSTESPMPTPRGWEMLNIINDKVYVSLGSDALTPTYLTVNEVGTFAPPPTNDVGVDQIYVPTITHNIGSAITPLVRVSNFGTAGQTGVAVVCSIVGAASAVRYVHTETIASIAGSDTAQVSFAVWNPSVAEVCTVHVRTLLAGDEAPGNDLKTKITTIGRHYYTGGPDDGQMRWIDSDTTGGPVYTWIDTIGATLFTVSTGTGDDGRGRVRLPFSFNYYSTSYDTMWICTNGWANFGAIDPGVNTYTNTTIPATVQPYNAIFPLWDDIYTTSSYGCGNIFTKTVGSAPTRQFAIIWSHVGFGSSPTNNVTFEAVLNESDNSIVFQYADVDYGEALHSWGLSATVGIDNLGGTTGLQYEFNGNPSGNLLANGRAIKFYYQQFDNDVGISAIINPTSTHMINVSLTPQASIRNYGILPQSSFAVVCSIFGAGSVLRYTDLQDISLIGMHDTLVSFTPWTPLIPETCTVKIATGLVGDQNASNDIRTRTTIMQLIIDASVTTITRPAVTESKRVPFVPQVTVSNNSSYVESIPVKAEIWSSTVGVTLSESFNGTTFPPTGWDTVRMYGTTTNAGWMRVTSGTYPTCTPHSGAAMAEYNSFSVNALNAKRLITPWTTIQPGNALDFWMYGDPGYAAWQETLDVEITSDTVNWSNLGRFDRYNTVAAWYERNISLSHYVGQAVRIAFTARSGYGNNMFIDDVLIANPVYTDSVLVLDVGLGDAIAEAYFKPCTLNTAGSYTFKVQSVLSGDMNLTNNNMSRVFSVNPITLTLISPVNNLVTTNNLPSFEWNSVAGATSYRIQVDDNSNFSSPTIDEVTAITNWIIEPGNEFGDGTYYWHVRVESPEPTDPYCTPWHFTVDTRGPNPPASTHNPPNGSTSGNQLPVFVWSDVSDADSFNLVVNSGKAEVLNIVTAETSFATTSQLGEGSYSWSVRGKDHVGNWGDFSTPPWTFSIVLTPAGWSIKEPLPSQVSGKYVKDGGSLVAVSTAKSGDVIYAFRGNKKKEFYKYTPGYPGSWAMRESIPYGVKPTDSTKINKKQIAKGASMCFDGDHTIYATKGNGTAEFWAYDVVETTWTAKAFVTVPKALKGGTSLVYYDGKVYLLAGSQKNVDPNFYCYDVGTNIWSTLLSLPLTPNGKVWKDGSSIALLGSTIYALKGSDKSNFFYAYDILNNTWLPSDSMPIGDSLFGKWKKKLLVKDGSAMTSGGSAIYALKGGGANVFYKYTAVSGWTHLESIPRVDKKSVPKTGAAMTYAQGKVWLLKGNNYAEFLVYTPGAASVAGVRPSTTTPTMIEHTSTPNAFNFEATPNPFTNLTTIRYSVPVSGRVSVKLYNTSGSLIETVNEGYMNAGTYTTNFLSKHLAQGIYFLRYSDNTNQAEIKLIVQ